MCVCVIVVQRCGQIDGWKRVKDASGKLQGIILMDLHFEEHAHICCLFHIQRLVFVSMRCLSPLLELSVSLMD